MTQLEKARQGEISAEMATVAEAEGFTSAEICEAISDGSAVIPCNSRHKPKSICGVGRGMRTKVNANIGTSQDHADLEEEIAKLKAAEAAGADTIMDLSTGGDIQAIRTRILEEASIPVGTVPIYAAVSTVVNKGGVLTDMTEDDMLAAIRSHCEDGVDFITVHCGVLKHIAEAASNAQRICGIVSRGGSFLARWMATHDRENPLYERFDDIIAMAKENDVTLSLGDGMRPGSILDAMDKPQVEELIVLSELAKRAFSAGVQVMIEGPGHVPIDQIEAQIKMEKELCNNAPFYVLGPLVTDVAPGYDHITSAIGGAIAAAAGADFLCYVTPAEHLSLPTIDQVREGVMAARVAAHAGDLAKRTKGAWEWDKSFSELRRKRDWKAQMEACMDPVRARQYREACKPKDDAVCSMCGDYCVYKVLDKDD